LASGAIDQPQPQYLLKLTDALTYIASSIISAEECSLTEPSYIDITP